MASSTRTPQNVCVQLNNCRIFLLESRSFRYPRQRGLLEMVVRNSTILNFILDRRSFGYPRQRGLPEMAVCNLVISTFPIIVRTVLGILVNEDSFQRTQRSTKTNKMTKQNDEGECEPQYLAECLLALLPKPSLNAPQTPSAACNHHHQ